MSPRFALIAAATITLAGCATAEPAGNITEETSSPWQFGVGARVTAEVAESEVGSLRGLVGVQRQWFDGGHDNIFTVGLQGRRPLKADQPERTWIGGELTYNNWRVQDDFTNPVSNVIGLAAMAGHPLGEGTVQVWGSAGLLFFGDFKADSEVSFEGGTGYQFQLGLAFPGLFERQ